MSISNEENTNLVEVGIMLESIQEIKRDYLSKHMVETFTIPWILLSSQTQFGLVLLGITIFK